MNSPEYTSLTQIANALLRRRWRIARACAWVFGLIVALSLLLGREYATESRFVPDAGSGSMGALAGLAAQFGISGAIPSRGPTPDFYVELSTSRTILGPIADTTFSFSQVRHRLWWTDTVEVTGTIAELYDIERPENPARERDDALELLQDLVTASSALETGIVTVRVTTDWPELSFAIAAMITDHLSKFSVGNMQSRAKEERQFVEARLAAQKAELATEEAELQRFLEQNRQFAGSPQLVLERNRLERNIAVRQQVVVGLAQGFEQSRIEEVRNTPVLTIVQAPEIPAVPVRRRLVLKLIAAMLMTAAVMGAVAVLQERSDYGMLSGEEEWKAFTSLRAEAMRDLTGWRRFVSRSRSTS
jgi:uncharacterized protein involved in exopolysaccharide biosynthesis